MRGGGQEAGGGPGGGPRDPGWGRTTGRGEDDRPGVHYPGPNRPSLKAGETDGGWPHTPEWDVGSVWKSGGGLSICVPPPVG